MSDERARILRARMMREVDYYPKETRPEVVVDACLRIVVEELGLMQYDGRVAAGMDASAWKSPEAQAEWAIEKLAALLSAAGVEP